MSEYRLDSRTVGALPIINDYMRRIGITEALRRVDATLATRIGPSPSQCLGVLLRNLVMDRGPIYALQGWGAPMHEALVGLSPEDLRHLNDDRVGRCLDALFDCDRASIQTEVVVRVIRNFKIDLDQVHNDSTSIKLTGSYTDADGSPQRGKPTVRAARGHSKDHRPDLKQLLWNLTVASDGAVPIHYRLYDGNQNDSPTHQETWDTVRELRGDPRFLYVADSKGCTTSFLQHVERHGGQFVVVLPRTRREDAWFRRHLQDHAVDWSLVNEAPTDEDLDAWFASEAPSPSAEGYRVVWLRSAAKARRDEESRTDKVHRCVEALHELDRRAVNPRGRLRTRQAIIDAAEGIVADAKRYVSYRIFEEDASVFKQAGPGRPGKNTAYKRVKRIQLRVDARVDEAAIGYDAKSDGMFPLLTNTDSDAFPLKRVFEAYKYQPHLEKRHQQLKSDFDVAPVFLKKITRIEALLFLYFLAMVVQALIERSVRLAMDQEGLASLPLYPEHRPCVAPTTHKVLAAFDSVQLHRLLDGNREVQVFPPDLTALQEDLVRLAGVPREAYVIPGGTR